MGNYDVRNIQQCIKFGRIVGNPMKDTKATDAHVNILDVSSSVATL